MQIPVVQIVEIGAGGGSIAWADGAGGLHVGPKSAGADPGPACYGRGGREPTLTDANLVAGRLDPSYFLGGAMKLDVDAAAGALERLGASLGTDVTATTRGVLRFAVAKMAHALRLVTVRRGHDPRDFTFVVYGGAGPLHAALLARELGISRIVIPPAPGHFSAVGMLLGRLRADAVRTRIGPLSIELLGPLLAELEAEGAEQLDRRGAARRAQVRAAPVHGAGAHAGGAGPRRGTGRRVDRGDPELIRRHVRGGVRVLVGLSRSSSWRPGSPYRLRAPRWDGWPTSRCRTTSRNRARWTSTSTAVFER